MRLQLSNLNISLFLLVASMAITMASNTSAVHAQDLEPRAYSNTPVGMNFLLVGVQHSQGALLFDPSLPVTDADARVNMGLLGYVRSLDVLGKSAKIGVKLPYALLSADGYVSGVYRTRETNGMADPSLLFTINIYGAPALSLKDFKNYQQETIVGLTFKLTPPLGVYEPDKLINLGTNRWSFEPEIGISRTIGQWTLEGAASVYLYTENDNFDNGKTRQQDPIYSVQAHAIYSIKNNTWVAIGGTYYAGGQTSIDGVANNDTLDNWRTGFTLVLPVNRYQSIKLFGSTGVSTRTGTDYDSLGVAWQYRWGAGL